MIKGPFLSIHSDPKLMLSFFHKIHTKLLTLSLQERSQKVAELIIQVALKLCVEPVPHLPLHASNLEVSLLDCICDDVHKGRKPLQALLALFSACALKYKFNYPADIPDDSNLM